MAEKSGEGKMKKKRVAKEDNEGVEKVMEENKNVSVPEPIKNCDGEW